MKMSLALMYASIRCIFNTTCVVIILGAAYLHWEPVIVKYVLVALSAIR